MSKKCTVCETVKDFSEFYETVKGSGKYRSACKKCIYEKEKAKGPNKTSKERSRRYYYKNREKRIQEVKEWKARNPDRVRENDRKGHRRYRQKHKESIAAKAKLYREKNKEKIYETQKKWKERNPEKVAAYRKTTYYKDLEKSRQKARDYQAKVRTTASGKIKDNLRRRVNHAVHGKKSENTSKLIGISIEGLMKHIEEQFDENMSWDNYGKFGWHIDHIRPCASFDLTDPKQQFECFHYTNLQPLWAEDNWSKGDTWGSKIEYELVFCEN